MIKKNQSALGTGAIILATLFWGMTFAFIKDAVATLSPLNFLFWRFGIASILLLIVFWKKIKFNKQVFLYGIVLGIFLAGTVVFQTIGLRYTKASTASFITGFSVILVALLESLSNKQWPSLYLFVSTLIAMIGIGFITLSNGLSINQGDIWILLCAFCFANYIICAGKASHIHQSFSLTFIQAAFVCILVGVGSFFTNKIAIPQQMNIWVSILFCSIFASIIAFVLQLQFQKHISATKAAIIFSLEPVFATITAAIYLHEKLTFQFCVGALMIFFAIIFSEKHTKQKIIPQE
ncbi:DMT family transporter [Legionella sp. PATHC038]|uniref:DMT family transporter n=1 Tax=Legionella sheltonii TaxID=2992041 RepID=UPI002244B83E|nr:DMT family transporter [Legionella sp. PATHC038]MCW8400854.1 DMT family transporter [Legionella sp. PATHC038]